MRIAIACTFHPLKKLFTFFLWKVYGLARTGMVAWEQVNDFYSLMELFLQNTSCRLCVVCNILATIWHMQKQCYTAVFCFLPTQTFQQLVVKWDFCCRQSKLISRYLLSLLLVEAKTHLTVEICEFAENGKLQSCRHYNITGLCKRSNLKLHNM